jgi:hypothetical protein
LLEKTTCALLRKERSKILSTQSILHYYYYYYYYYDHPHRQFPKSCFQKPISRQNSKQLKLFSVDDDHHHHPVLGWLTYMLYVILRDITMKVLLLANHVVVVVPMPMLINV